MKTRKTKEPEYVAETLAWCNERRKERNQEPLTELPKGVRMNGFSCPCGKACGFYVGAYKYGPNREELSRLGKSIPTSVQRFVAHFDSGLLPEYEE